MALQSSQNKYRMNRKRPVNNKRQSKFDIFLAKAIKFIKHNRRVILIATLGIILLTLLITIVKCATSDELCRFIRFNTSDQKITRVNDQYHLSLETGASYKLDPIVLPANTEDKTLTYATNNSNIAYVDKNGTVFGIAVGETEISIKNTKSGIVAKLIVNVTVPEEQLPKTTEETTEDIMCTSISVSTKTLTINVGATETVTARVVPWNAKDQDILWKSSDSSVATVNKSGKITAIKEGNVTIEAVNKASDVSTSIEVTVTDIAFIEKIELSFNNVELTVGETAIPSINIQPADAEDKTLTWISGNESVATVDSNGIITARGVGDCDIIVRAVANENIVSVIKVKVKAYIPEITEATYINGVLIVNKTYGLPNGFVSEASGEAKAALSIMQAAALDEEINLWVVSGYRTNSQQEQLYNSYVKKDGQEKADSYSARPGYSEHQTGLAFDLNAANDEFANTPEAKWIADNCYKYGFILRYPKDKESITGYKYEPWHVRYVGVELATSLHQSGLTLEEYLGVTSVYAQ